ncbi:BA75_01438T0 [Komagataella pastoris]|uniref:mitogen-activated protein kinase kinase n=1 Tax=Komagataella pastoris TaxID=4922 RepID=A0A1B2J818_PICPA|nr:BA75_01438T0 [Komagataella pastoris]
MTDSVSSSFNNLNLLDDFDEETAELEKQQEEQKPSISRNSSTNRRQQQQNGGVNDALRARVRAFQEKRRTQQDKNEASDDTSSPNSLAESPFSSPGVARAHADSPKTTWEVKPSPQSPVEFEPDRYILPKIKPKVTLPQQPKKSLSEPNTLQRTKPKPNLSLSQLKSYNEVDESKKIQLAQQSLRGTPVQPARALPNQQNVRVPKAKLSLSERKGLNLNCNLGTNSLKDNSRSMTVGEVLSKRGQLPRQNKAPPKAQVQAPPQQQQQQPAGGMFANYTKYIDVESGSLNFSGKASVHSKGIDFSSGSSFRISLDDLEYIEELGRGNYGTVSKVLHKPTNVIMAMKEVRLELDESKFRQILMELEILHNCVSNCIVDFYGAFLVEGAVYMCIEYMNGGSLDKIYADVGIPEPQLAYITKCVVSGLKTLKDKHNIIHRDVKPTNILVNDQGKVKLCDFGVSGNLVASMARTNIGCQSYMAPERIKSVNPDDISYTVQSDIWSLGLSILEMAKGCYPYPPETYDNIFSQLSAIVDGEPPTLPEGKFSPEAQDFVAQCLQKDAKLRPTYALLEKHPWLQRYADDDKNMADMKIFVTQRLQDIESTKVAAVDTEKQTNSAPATSASSVFEYKKVPALHRGGLPK